MSTFESIPLEIRHQVYALLLCGNPGGEWSWHVLADALLAPKILQEDKASMQLHPAIMGVSRQIHAEAASVLYGWNRFHFDNTPVVLNFKRWLRRVGSDNLRRIRKAAVNLESNGPATQGLYRMSQMDRRNRVFTECLKRIIIGCPELRDLVITECDMSLSNYHTVPIADHVLALTRVRGLERLRLRRWSSLYAADQMIRVLGLSEKSEVWVERFHIEAVGKKVVEYDFSRYHVLINQIENEDEVTADRAGRSWDVFKKALGREKHILT